MKAIGATQRIFDLLDRVPKNEAGSPVTPRDVPISFQEVTFAYPTRPEVDVLADFSLELEPNKVTALVGASGAGKSTVAALLARPLRSTDGAIYFGGTDIRELDAKDYRAMIGFVGQEPVLFSGSIRENLAYGRHDKPATEAELESIATRAHVSEFIERFSDGWDTLVGERGVQLSGGQKQRIAIARALLRDPKILILDEATSALDARSEQLVQKALDELMTGRTTLIIAHDSPRWQMQMKLSSWTMDVSWARHPPRAAPKPRCLQKTGRISFCTVATTPQRTLSPLDPISALQDP